MWNYVPDTDKRPWEPERKTRSRFTYVCYYSSHDIGPDFLRK